uniref:Uncharacterized protein n=1 Tax=Ranid herpesvirus 4 TaxID=2849006 RepID=A0A8F3CIM8_9VIRU|nr:MAG: hypothetical protein [Ranid herpesvirus 4]
MNNYSQYFDCRIKLPPRVVNRIMRTLNKELEDHVLMDVLCKFDASKGNPNKPMTKQEILISLFSYREDLVLMEIFLKRPFIYLKIANINPALKLLFKDVWEDHLVVDSAIKFYKYKYGINQMYFHGLLHFLVEGGLLTHRYVTELISHLKMPESLYQLREYGMTNWSVRECYIFVDGVKEFLPFLQNYIKKQRIYSLTTLIDLLQSNVFAKPIEELLTPHACSHYLSPKPDCASKSCLTEAEFKRQSRYTCQTLYNLQLDLNVQFDLDKTELADCFKATERAYYRYEF